MRTWTVLAPTVIVLAVSVVPALAHASRVVFVNTEPLTISAGASDDPGASGLGAGLASLGLLGLTRRCRAS